MEYLQKIVDELKKDPQYAQYIKQGKLSLLDSRFDYIDALLRSGTIKGME
jgi:hypothetical protein